MLSDMGGVFGFFLGVTMVNCVKKTWSYAARSRSAISKRNFSTAFRFRRTPKMKFQSMVSTNQTPFWQRCSNSEQAEQTQRYEVVIRGPLDGKNSAPEAYSPNPEAPPPYKETA